jgi:hypothetical protein
MLPDCRPNFTEVAATTYMSISLAVDLPYVATFILPFSKP